MALIAVLLVLLPNLVLTGLGLAMRGQAQQAAGSQITAHFGLSRFLRQVGLCAFLVLPTGLWLWRRRAAWTALGWRSKGLGRAAGLGALLAAATLLLRARPFSPEQLGIPATWWAMATYAVVASAEEMLYRGFLQGCLKPGWDAGGRIWRRPFCSPACTFRRGSWAVSRWPRPSSTREYNCCRWLCSSARPCWRRATSPRRRWCTWHGTGPVWCAVCGR